MFFYLVIACESSYEIFFVLRFLIKFVEIYPIHPYLYLIKYVSSMTGFDLRLFPDVLRRFLVEDG